MAPSQLRDPRLLTVSAAPRFLWHSGGVGWQGAMFTELIAAPARIVDHVHEHYWNVALTQRRVTLWATAQLAPACVVELAGLSLLRRRPDIPQGRFYPTEHDIQCGFFAITPLSRLTLQSPQKI